MPPNRIISSFVFWLVIGSLIGWLGWGVISGKSLSLDRHILTKLTDGISTTPTGDPAPTGIQDFVTNDVEVGLGSITGYIATSSPTLRRPDATSAAQVKRVIDGDTIELSDGQVVRYIGIDTPETKHPNKAVQCYGEEATSQNEAMVLGKMVILEQDVSNTDRYGRLLRYVWVDDQLINWQLVVSGFAFAKSYPPDVAYQASFNQAQQFARENEQGLWGVCSP